MNIGVTKEELDILLEALIVYKNKLEEIDDGLNKFGMSDDCSKKSLEVLKEINNCNKLLSKLRNLAMEE